MEPCHLLIDKECVWDPDLFDVVCTNNQLVNIGLR